MDRDERPSIESERDRISSNGVPQNGDPRGHQRARANGAILWRAANAWQRAMRHALEPLSLTHVQYILLGHLSHPDWDGGAITQAKLARHSGVDEMMTSQVIRVLESKGLVERHAHRTDSRAKILNLTLKGLAVTREATDLVEGVEHDFFAPMGASLPSVMLAMEKVLSPL